MKFLFKSLACFPAALALTACVPEDKKQPAERPQTGWASLGGYFGRAFDFHGTNPENYTEAQRQAFAPVRFESLRTRYESIARKNKIDPYKVCMPAREASELKYELNDIERDGQGELSREQKIIVELIKHMSTTGAYYMLVYAAEKNEVIICVQNEPGFHGTYKIKENTISIGFQTQGLKDFLKDEKATPETHPAEFGELLFTFAEEIAHAYQQHELNSLYPYIYASQDADGNDKYARPDMKLWYLFSEAHAKVMAALVMQEIGRDKPQLLKALLDSESTSADKEIFRVVRGIYQKHGEDEVRRDPSLLWPAYKKFFQRAGLNGWYDDCDCKAINGIPSDDKDRIPMREFVRAFGELPLMFDNALEELWSDQKVENFVNLMPENNLSGWFRRSYKNLEEGKRLPEMEFGTADCPYKGIRVGSGSSLNVNEGPSVIDPS